MKSRDLYIDLGTANTLIYVQNRGLALNEPTLLAYRERAKRTELFAIGKTAKLMLGKTPAAMSVVKPLHEGVISDFGSTAKLLHGFVNRIKQNTFWLRPRMLISLPCQVTEFEKRAVEEAGYALGARQVHLLDEPVAAAVGAGLPVLSHQGCMIVDIGGGTTEIAVLSVGGIVTSQAVRVGGDALDMAIIEHVRARFRFSIGEQTAERVKIEVGSAVFSTIEKRAEVGGFDLTRGLPGRFIVTSNMIFPAVDSVVQRFITAIFKTLELCPPDISGDLAKNGIVLAGGGALLDGLAPRLSQAIGIPVRVAQNPLLAVANGGARTLEDSRLFDILERKS